MLVNQFRQAQQISTLTVHADSALKLSFEAKKANLVKAVSVTQQVNMNKIYPSNFNTLTFKQLLRLKARQNFMHI